MPRTTFVLRLTAAAGLTLAAALFCTFSAPAAAQLQSPPPAVPQPSPYPIAWEFDFRYDAPRRIVVDRRGQRSPQAYWYMTYTVVNNTDQERMFFPRFELVTRSGNVIRSDRNIPAEVFQTIKRRTGDRMLEDALSMTMSPLLVGEDQQRRGVAIWREPEAELGAFTVFVGGLSGEATEATGVGGEPIADADGEPVLLFKTKQIDYRLLGDELYAGRDTLRKLGERWVMR